MQSTFDGRSDLISSFDHLKSFWYWRWIRGGCWMVEKKSDEGSFLFDFFLIQKSKNSSRSLTREEIGLLFCSRQGRKKSTQILCLKEGFWSFFSSGISRWKALISWPQNYSLFMVVAQTRLNRIRAGVYCNSNHFEFQFDSNFFLPISDLKRDLPKKIGHKNLSKRLSFLTHNGSLQKQPTCGRIWIRF